jgi:response regulator RpfG family c-di-GMP phosphodiesterase
MFLQNLADCQELEQLRNEHQAFLRQVTNDFEELTFLRSMSRLLEISDLSFDFIAMGEKLLGTLAPLLDTEALVLIIADGTCQASNNEVFEPRCWTGLRVVSDDTCRRLVRKYRAPAAIQPVVKNHLHESPEGTEFDGVRDFILVPIVTAGSTIGWLLALNRDNEQSLQATALPWGISYLEFGTHEATLMSSSAAILATHARNVELFREREELLISVVRVLVTAIEAKDEYTCGHSERVALYAKRLAQECGHDEEYCERLYLTGLLHDIGKIGVRDAVLRKPGPLTDDEFEEIKQHPDKGWQILHDLIPLHYVLDGVLFHHEQFDGRGYPDRLAGPEIPLHGRLLAVCDAFDAMTSDRPYRTGMPQERAESILRAGAGRQWDPELIDAFFRCMPDIITIKESYQWKAQTVRRAKVEMHQPA